MKNGAGLVMRGTILGSLVLAVLGWLLAGQIRLPGEAEVAYAAAPVAVSPQPDTPAQGIEGSEAPEQCQVSLSYPEGILQWCEIITREAIELDLPPNLVAAVMLQESGGDKDAYSGSGAVGLMQVMPRDGIAAEFECINGPCFASRPTIDELLEPGFNIKYGAGMLAGLINRLGSEREALKSYGPMDMGYSYADRVLAIYENYGD
jgi:soluble lytic murein transglycosylase-like protein